MTRCTCIVGRKGIEERPQDLRRGAEERVRACAEAQRGQLHALGGGLAASQPGGVGAACVGVAQAKWPSGSAAVRGLGGRAVGSAGGAGRLCGLCGWLRRGGAGATFAGLAVASLERSSASGSWQSCASCGIRMATGSRHSVTPMASGSSGFERLASQLYCAGAMDQACPLGTGTRSAAGQETASAGQCHWTKAPRWEPVTATEVSKNQSVWARNAARLASDRWDPRPKWGSDFRMFGPEAAAKCVRDKNLLIAGDSTTRDTFYEVRLPTSPRARPCSP